MIIYDKTGNELLNIEVDDTSVRVRKIMQDNSVTLYYSLSSHIEIPVFSYILYEGERYTLWSPSNFTKHGTRNFEYTVVFGSYQEFLKRLKFKLVSAIPYELKFTITAKPVVILQAMIDCLNKSDSGWTLGECIDMPEIVFSVNHEYIWDSLSRLADQCKTEFEVFQKNVSLRKVEKFKNDPLPLSYGKGKGFCPGLSRQNKGNKAPVTVLYIQGGERNIDLSKYGSRTLLLPRNQEIEYEGRRYKTDENGMFIVRADRELTVFNEDSFDASDIYPSRVGEVGVVSYDSQSMVYSFVDNSIPEDLNYENYIIAGTTMTIIFQTGSLTSREFEVRYTHADRRFDIVPATMDGYDLPNENLKPSLGDKYAIFNISLPEAYVCNNTTQEGASWDMFRVAVRYLFESEDDVYAFTGELDGIWSGKQWLAIRDRLLPGGYVALSDVQFQEEPVSIRITGITEYINKTQSPQLDLSNAPVATSVGSELGKIDANDAKNEYNNKRTLQYTDLRWRDIVELAESLKALVSLGFTEGIKPMSIQAMMQYMGHSTLQYKWVTSKTKPVEIDHQFIMNDANKTFSSPAGIIQHMTIGIDTLAPDHAVSEYKFWDISALEPYYVGNKGALWLYLKCSKANQTGSFVFSENEIALESVSGYYHFLVGFLNSEYQGTRNFTTLYGFAMLTAGMLRINKVASTDGSQFMDFLNKIFRIGNNNSFFDYNNVIPETILYKGIMVQSPAGGDPTPAAVPRGAYSPITPYALGDVVIYNGGSYRYINPTITKGNPPTNATYWEVFAAKGADGEPGSDGKPGKDGAEGIGYQYAYYPSDSETAPPAPTGIGGDWWSYPPLDEISKYIYVSQRIKTNGTWGSWSPPALYSVRPTKGEPGALPVTKQWVQGQTYYRNEASIDYIMYRPAGQPYATPTWWRVKLGYTSAVAGATPSTNYFEQISSYEALATNVLLSNEANLAEFIFKDGQLLSQALTNGIRNIILNGKTGFAQFAAGNVKMNADGSVEIIGKISTSDSGNRIIIDPNNRVIQMINSSNKEVARLSFENTSGYQSTPKLEMFLYTGSGSLVYKTVMDYSGFKFIDASGNTVAQIGGQTVLRNLPIVNPGVSGMIWVDSNGYLRRSTG
ncbi:hypothetical protein LJC39_01885 [Parabacteroides sp. OttesenSCG-928-B22]|nr:hypothetical protein [Parabacteroides sp. OttesenSCG-928-B22]